MTKSLISFVDEYFYNVIMTLYKLKRCAYGAFELPCGRAQRDVLEKSEGGMTYG